MTDSAPPRAPDRARPRRPRGPSPHAGSGPTGAVSPAERRPATPGATARVLAAFAAASLAASAAAFSTATPAAAQVETITLEGLRQANEVDSAYATPALRAFVARAAEATSRLPELLESYHTRVESEISILQADPTGREVVLQLEQVASDVAWRRDTPTVQRVVGYRARTMGPIPSALTMFEVPWVVPTLYGDRIDLVRWSAPTTDDDGRVRRRRAIHPLGPERARVYRFTGGDTVLTLNLPERRIPLVRVQVTPVRFPERPTLLFEGHMDIDATRHQIVRMRGRMIPADPDPSLDERLLGAAFTGATFVEFESAEYDQRFWLPRYQRIEVQAISRLTETRVALRVVSAFEHPWPNEAGYLAERYPDPPPGGLLVLGDAVAEQDFGEWENPLGELTAETNAQDFIDLDPRVGRDPDEGHLGFGVRHFSHLLRFNEAEGIYTGGGLTWTPGRAWREGRVRAWGGWAWKEKTVRGGLSLSHLAEGSRWEWVARAERQILGTSDFGLGYGQEPGVPPLVATEEEPLYDHLVAGLVARQPRSTGWAWRLEASRARDRPPGNADVADVGGDPDAPTLPAVAEGSYWFGRVTVERNPGATGFGVVPGTAVRLDAQAGTGELDWIRVEAGISSRRIWGDFSLEGRLDGGVTLSDAPPPQRLFELGRYSGLPGYEPRAFSGDRVALAQTALSYTLPLLRRPLGGSGFWLPALAPAPTVILRAGWTDASNGAAAVLDGLGARTTDGVRATLGLRLRLFGGGVSVGAARPLDRDGEWRFVWSLAREL